MEASAHSQHEHHAMPTSGSCAIGEVLGMVIGTAAGFSDLGTIVLAIVIGTTADSGRRSCSARPSSSLTRPTPTAAGTWGKPR